MSEARPATPLWIRITLFLSLAVNLLIVGLVLGVLISRGPPSRDAPPPGAVYFRALEAEDRRAISRAMRAEWRAVGRPKGPNLAGVVALLRAEPFDRAALESAVAAQNAQGDLLRAAGQKALLDRIAEMTPAERQAYALRLETARGTRGTP